MTFLHLSMASTQTGGSSDSKKIARMQEVDRWRAESTATVPIELTALRVLRVGLHGDLEVEVRTEASSWVMGVLLAKVAEWHKDLEVAFPVEAGKVGKHKSILPVLCPKRMRKGGAAEAVQEYADRLLALPKYMQQSKVFVEFFLHNQVSGGPASGAEQGPQRGAKTKVKVRIGREMAMVYLTEGECVMEKLREQVRRKFDLDSADEGACSYTDAEGDEIQVLDDEDLQVALQLFPVSLVLSR